MGNYIRFYGKSSKCIVECPLKIWKKGKIVILMHENEVLKKDIYMNSVEFFQKFIENRFTYEDENIQVELVDYCG